MTTELTRRVALFGELIESGVLRDPNAVPSRHDLGVLKTRAWQAVRAFGADPTRDNEDAVITAGRELDEACEKYRLAHFPNALRLFALADFDLGQPLSIWAVFPTGPECVFEEGGRAMTVMQPSLHWPHVRRIDDEAERVSKHVFTNDTAVAEAVLYRYPTYAERTVICCSTQSGCPVGCRFCGAGDAFVRSLTEDEIVAQPVHLLDGLEDEGVDVQTIGRLQIMFMSMGEPLLNLKHLVPALRRLHALYPRAVLLISTSAPRVDYAPFREISAEIPTIGLQFSVHESTDEARNLLVPFKAKLTLSEMSAEGEEWARVTRRRPFFNYCVHDRNDKQEDVERLLAHFDPRLWEATISVICERDESMSVAHHRQRDLTGAFMEKMTAAGYSTRMFDPAGQDTIGGGCGQLWFVQSWFDENPTLARRSVGRDLPVVHAPTEEAS